MDMADKYPPAESFEDDEEVTVKMQVPDFHPQIVVSEDGHTVEVIEHIGSPEEVGDFRTTIPSPPPETTYPGVGLILTFGVSLVFWGTLAYFFWR